MAVFPTRYRLKTILALGLPITGGMLSQSLLNLVDTLMVGQVGEQALAGVGVAGYVNFMVVALILGLSAAVQARVARRQGEGRERHCAQPVINGLVLAVLLCVPLMLFCSSYAEWLLHWVTQRDEVLAVAIPYFEYRVPALLAVGMSFCFRGYWNGINRGWVFLRILISMHLLNIVISYGLIFGAFGLPELGAPGAGLGTTIALYIGALISAIVTFRSAWSQGLFARFPTLEDLREILSLSLPNSFQQFMFAASITVLFAIIGQLGTHELAIAQVLINISLLLILPAVGLGMSATTFVSRSLGRKEPVTATEYGWDVVKLATLTLVLLSLPLWLFPEAILSLFLQSPEALEKAVLPLQIGGLAICVDATAIVMAQALLGAGANRTVMSISIIGQWLFYLPLAWLLGPYLGGGLLAIWLVQLLHRGLSSVVYAYIWSQKRWAHIRL